MSKINIKMGVIGAGDIGFMTSELLALAGFDVVIYNRYHEVDGKPSPYWLSKMGRLMDTTDGLQIEGCGTVNLSKDLKDLDDAFAVVITAGAKRTNIHETREELAEKNCYIIGSFAEFVARNKNTLIMIVTNPVDALTQYLIETVVKISGENANEIAKRVTGVSLVDSLRLKNLVREYMLLAKSMDLKPHDIEAYAIGEHGPSMVPLISQVKIKGAPFSDYVSTTAAKEIFEQTVLRGNDIIKLTGASSVNGPAYAAMHMAKMIATNTETNIICSSFDGTRAIGNMVKFKSGKISEIIKLDLDENEERQYINSCAILDKQYKLILDRVNLAGK